MRVTLKDVAKAAGVSTATVSHVLNETKAVSPATRARVETAMDTLGYRLSLPARALRTGRHRVLGLLLPDLTNPFFPQLAQAVTETAWRLGYGLMLSESRGDPEHEAQALVALEERGDGIIWVPTTRHPAYMPQLPTVVIDRAGRELAAFDGISSDHRAGGRLLAQMARELGHRRIGLLAGPADSVSGRRRREALCEELGALEPEWTVEVPYALDLPREATAQLTGTDVTLVIAANDAVAIGALHVLKAHGRHVPQDVSLFGFDDIPWATLVDPPLTTVRQPVRDIGRRAVDRLHRRLSGEGGDPAHIVLPVQPIFRGSSTTAREKISS